MRTEGRTAIAPPNDAAAACDHERLYEEVIASFGAALERLARGYERDAEARRDLLQEIHVALWRSLEGFDGRCSLRTWVYRVAHNTASSVASRPRLRGPALVSLEELAAEPPARPDAQREIEERLTLERLLSFVDELVTLDRQVILLYLEGLDRSAIGEITGLSAGNVSTKVHRIKRLLARRFAAGGVK